MLKNHTALAILILISQIVAVMAIFLSFGFVNNAVTEEKQADVEQRMFRFGFYIDGCAEMVENDPDVIISPEYKELKEKIDELIDFVGDDFEVYYLYGSNRLNNEDFSYCTAFGDLKSEDENPEGVFTSTKTIAIVASGETASEKVINIKKGDTVTLFGTQFEIIDNEDYLAGDYLIPYSLLPDEAHVSAMQLTLKDIPTSSRVREINNKFIELFGEAEYQTEPEIRDLVDEQSNNMYISASIIVMIIIMLNISLYYKYLFDLRLVQTSSMKLCGATNSDILAINTIEMIVEYLFSFAISMIIFISSLGWLRNKIAGFDVYTDKQIFVILAMAYFIVSVIISIIISMPYSKHSPVKDLTCKEE